MLDRRDILIGAGAVTLGALALPKGATALMRGLAGEAKLTARIRAIEASVAGRLGVSVLDTASGSRFAWRGDERFPLCSTFKFLLASAVLKHVEQGRERLDRRIAIARSDILDNSPVTERFVGGALSVERLCEATMTLSDNTAANMLLPGIGGIAGFNAFVRTLDDRVTRLDRGEPALGGGIPGDPRDTTSPNAMLHSMQAILLGNALRPDSHQKITAWLLANKTGGARFRAGLPAGWRVGDKTGTGEYGSTNDIAILWPPKRKPLLITGYLTETKATSEARYAALAKVARAVSAEI